jgi:hypothetical protein
MAYPCNTCHGFGQWWEWMVGKTQRRSFCIDGRPRDVPSTARHVVCTDCMGGISSCCDGAVEAQQSERG